MPNRRIRIIVLAEDRAHREILYRYLAEAGHNPARCRFNLAPSGSGDAKQYVRGQLPGELEAQQTNHAHSVLIVMTDADHEPVVERLRSLGPLPHGGVFVLIPKRNIETWVRWAGGTAVDEETDYSKTIGRLERADITNTARTLLALARGQAVSQPVLPSLQTARPALKGIAHAANA